MDDGRDLATLASLVGDPTRAAMLASLLDGTAHTATELALDGGVSPSTASSHLARLVQGGLVSVARQGRHRYVRLASAEVAAVLEGLLRLAPPGKGNPSRRGPRDPRLRHARVCYDHLAGEVAVGFLDRLRAANLVTGDEAVLALSPAGVQWCEGVGIDLAALAKSRRPWCRPCLDWSERRSHLAGAVGAALLDRLFAWRYARREPNSRALTLTARGERFLERLE